jgi:nicotinamide-nucleotide amidase
LTRLRASIVITGTELVRGQRTDRNGPFLARDLDRRGIQSASIRVVGDRMEELEAALREALDADLCVISGGLGPTHDDRTAEALARVTRRELAVDAALQAEVETVSRSLAARTRRPYADYEEGVRKQAALPQGALSLGLAGTAPGILLEVDSRVVLALPGPPGELRRLWGVALETEPLQRLLARAQPVERHVMRFFGASESAVAGALAAAGGERSGVEATVCARDFEVHVELVGDGGEDVAEALRASLGDFLFAEDDRPVAAIVLELCRKVGVTLATAESCTGGLVGEMLTEIPGSSDAYLGGVVAYSDDLKRSALGVPEDVLRRHGAVSAGAAEAMARGARARLGADVAVSATGIAGPGGGTPEKPVGLVYLHAEGGGGGLRRDFVAPGSRTDVRRRAAVSALHLVRRLLTQSRRTST